MTALRLPTGQLEDIPPFRSQGLPEPVLFRGLGHVELEPDDAPVPYDCACGEPFQIDRHLSDPVQVGQYRGHLAGRAHREYAGEEA